MAMAYIKLYHDWMENTETLSLEEKGRLIDALVEYSRGGDWQEKLSGNERHVFPLLRARIDRSVERYERACERREEINRAYARLRKQETRKQESSEQENKNQETREQETEPSVLKKIDNNWRTSARARGGAAQLLVDFCLSENLPCGGMKNLFDELVSAMETGLSPEEILSCCQASDGTNLGYELYTAMKKRGLSAR